MSELELEYKIEELKDRIDELAPHTCPHCHGEGGDMEYCGEGISEYYECFYCDDKLKMSDAEIALVEAQMRYQNVVIDLQVEIMELKRLHPHHCGICHKFVKPADAVRIRHIDAPNPFCSMSCANTWSTHNVRD